MLQVRIHGGGRRETVECLHQGIGQYFDIEAGKGCDQVTAKLSVIFNTLHFLEPDTNLFNFFNTYLSIILNSVTVVANYSHTCCVSFSACIKRTSLYNNHIHCDLQLPIIWDR